MDMPAAKRKIGLLWFLACGGLTIVVVIQSLLGHYGTAISDVWSWYLPTVVPTLSLIVGVFVADAKRTSTQPASVDTFVFLLAIGFSTVYLCFVGLPILVEPFVDVPPLTLMKTSNLWLIPLQGMVIALLGVFFIKKTS